MSKIDRQREHQANERTFLAWLRTSIGLIGFGFALSRFGLFLRELQITVTQQDIPTHLLHQLSKAQYYSGNCRNHRHFYGGVALQPGLLAN
jgi:uncharacterized membrane protein YidH (DUF202 family)